MKISSVGSNCNTAVKTSAKTVTTPSRKHRSPRHPNALGSYLAITAGAAAVSLPNADAAVVYYNGAAVTVTSGSYLYWDVNNMTAGATTTSTSDRFQIRFLMSDFVYTRKDENLLKMYVGLGAATYFTSGYSYGWMYALRKTAVGATIDVNTPWFGNTSAYLARPDWDLTNSNWETNLDGTQGIVPFYFHTVANSSDKYYGWADITYNAVSESLTLNNFAYNNTPNAGIIAEAIPEPSSMLLLAMGGSSVLAVRRRRKSQQTAELIAS